MKPYPKYKDSGVPWIGDVPEHWSKQRLKYCLTLINDKNVDDSTNKIALENIESWTGKYIETSTEFSGNGAAFKQNDILFGKLRPYLAKVWQAEFDGNAVGDIFVYQANKEIVPRFAFYRFISRDFIDIVNGSTFGAKMPRASSEFIGNLTFVYPPLPEQTAIAAYLDRKTAQIDALIEKKRRLIELLQEERTALISHAVTKGLNPAAKMKDSGVEWIGDVPEGWEVLKLKYVFHFLDHRRIPLSADERGKMANKMYDYYGASGIIDKVDDYIFDETTILIGEDGANLLARSSRLAFIAQGKYWVNNHAHILKPKNGNINYLVELLEIVDYTDYVTGSAQPKLSQENLGKVLLPIPPPLPEQTAIAAYLDRKTAQIDALIENKRRLIELLQEYRTALISAAVTGKIDVRKEVSESQS